MTLFSRSSSNPILTPTDRWWETRAVFNPAAAWYEGRIALVYRAVGGDGLSRFGLAWSSNGEVIEERSELPVYEAELGDLYGRLGVEDPRVVALDGRFYLTYCKASVETADTPPLYWEIAPFRVRTAVAVTDDFREIREIATVLPDTNTKDGVLFREKLDGRYVMLVRDFPSIQYLTSSDLTTWSEPVTLMEPRPGTWEGERIGAGPPPVRTPWGWLLLYHANEYLRMPRNQRMYRMGLAALDGAEPSRVVYRHPEPVFSPEAPYELAGPVGNVVFGTGLIELNDRYLLYYGAGDGVIGVASAQREAIFSLLRSALGDPP
jgi:predicted GH43/DUF377 family glycosyl hydrolase